MNFKLLKLLCLFLFLVGFGACTSDKTEDLPEPDTRTLWSGATLTFEKTANMDPNQSANQDRLTENVWLTRGNDGGQIYNTQVEDTYDKDQSPAGTLWAVGDINNIDNLSFKSFRETVKPKEVIGKELVLFLVEDNIFLSVKFTKWSQEKEGGFAYDRSTP